MGDQTGTTLAGVTVDKRELDIWQAISPTLEESRLQKLLDRFASMRHKSLGINFKDCDECYGVMLDARLHFRLLTPERSDGT